MEGGIAILLIVIIVVVGGIAAVALYLTGSFAGLGRGTQEGDPTQRPEAQPRTVAPSEISDSDSVAARNARRAERRARRERHA